MNGMKRLQIAVVLCWNAATDLDKFIKACGVPLRWGAALVDFGDGGGRGQRLDARQHHPGLSQVSGQTAALPLHGAAGGLNNRKRGTHWHYTTSPLQTFHVSWLRTTDKEKTSETLLEWLTSTLLHGCLQIFTLSACSASWHLFRAALSLEMIFLHVLLTFLQLWDEERNGKNLVSFNRDKESTTTSTWSCCNLSNQWMKKIHGRKERFNKWEKLYLNLPY